MDPLVTHIEKPPPEAQIEFRDDASPISYSALGGRRLNPGRSVENCVRSTGGEFAMLVIQPVTISLLEAVALSQSLVEQVPEHDFEVT
ncbi:hypothetical protein [Subtercola boreus]|uniref:hypothetical protein n=1 Tax=Subtercola boreus TaxID=120213 RepID=UPI0011C0395A|nr:hypothetical protein [Subtercola boreus]